MSNNQFVIHLATTLLLSCAKSNSISEHPHEAVSHMSSFVQNELSGLLFAKSTIVVADNIYRVQHVLWSRQSYHHHIIDSSNVWNYILRDPRGGEVGGEGCRLDVGRWHEWVT